MPETLHTPGVFRNSFIETKRKVGLGKKIGYAFLILAAGALGAAYSLPWVENMLWPK